MKSESVLGLMEARTPSLVGGKGAWLSKLMRAKINVPRGFVITTRAQFPLNETLKTEILAQFEALNSARVAVRSSAVNEDGASQSFAGQYDTLLNVERANLIQAITQVHASAANARTKSYAPGETTQIAIVVQTMVAAELSGVAFTTNPLNQNSQEMMIEITRGLGEKLVSGATTPDLWIMDKTSREILAHEPGAEPLNLPENLLNQIISAAETIAKLAKKPMDIEFAIRDDELFILQARPITTLTKGAK
jgi:pyruvate,water dikinase